MSITRALARMLLAPVFIYGGWDVLKHPEGRVKLATEAGTPRADVAVRANAALMVGAGSFMLLGIVPRFAALALATSLVPTTLAGHPWWRREGADQKQQVTHFLKNLSTIGGLLLFALGG